MNIEDTGARLLRHLVDQLGPDPALWDFRAIGEAVEYFFRMNPVGTGYDDDGPSTER